MNAFAPVPRVLLTDPIHPDGEALLAAAADIIVAPDTAAATLRALARDADALLVRSKLPDDIFQHAARLKGVVRHGVGLDIIPLEAAARHGIVVANTPGINTRPVAEYVFAALFDLKRSLAAVDGRLRHSGWNDARDFGVSRGEIGGMTLAIIGLGAIGTRVAQMARAGFGMEVLGVTRSGVVPEGVESVSLDDAFRRADALVLACPLTPQTRAMVDARRLGLMKPGALLINVARGPVVETPALVAALREGRLGGAALDVHDVQPLDGSEALFALPNVLLTPHLAGITATSLRAMSMLAAQETLRIVSGEPPLHRVELAAFV